jgi:predicted nicotinamide N-methyase
VEILDEGAFDPPDVDLILAGDLFYEREMAGRVLIWLEAAHSRGIQVLIGDPGREFFPRARFERLALYEVPAAREIEGVEIKSVGVYTFPSGPADLTASCR